MPRGEGYIHISADEYDRIFANHTPEPPKNNADARDGNTTRGDITQRRAKIYICDKAGLYDVLAGKELKIIK